MPPVWAGSVPRSMAFIVKAVARDDGRACTFLTCFTHSALRARMDV